MKEKELITQEITESTPEIDVDAVTSNLSNLNDPKTSASVKETSTKRLRAIDFAIDELDIKKVELSDAVKTNTSALAMQVGALKTEIANQQQATILLKDEISKIAMIPDMFQRRFSIISPEIAREVEKIYSQKTLELEEAYSTHREKLEISIADAMTKSGEFIAKVQKDSEMLIQSNRKAFYKLLLSVAFCAIITSSLTSYLVTHYFPTNVLIKGAQSLEISNSKVEVFGGSNLQKVQKAPTP